MSISSMLSALNANYANIVSLIPTKYNFTDEPTASLTSINDGGTDMYDGSNVFNTNLTNAYNTVKTGGYNSRLNSSIPYAHTKHASTTFSFNGNGSVTSGTSYFGSGSSYFTNLYPGMFVLIATGISITELSITGNIGVDGGGTLTTNDSTITVGGNSYAYFRKTISGSTDPSINHIMIIPGSGSGVTHSWDTTRQYDDDVIQGLSGISTIYCLVIARASGAALSNSDAINVITEFLETVGGSGASSQNITGSSIDSSESISSNNVSLKIAVSSVDSSESISSNNVSLKIVGSSIDSSESISSPNNVAFLIHSITEISSLESVSSNKLNLNIIQSSISSAEDISQNEINQTIETPTSISTLEGFETPVVNLTLQMQSASDLSSVGEPTQVDVCLTINVEGIESGCSFETSTTKRYFYVSGLIPRGDNFYHRSGKDALVPAITVLNQKLYLRDQTQITGRQKKGFYLENEFVWVPVNKESRTS